MPCHSKGFPVSSTVLQPINNELTEINCKCLIPIIQLEQWEGFESAVEEVALGSETKCMSLLTFQESSENKEYGAEV